MVNILIRGIVLHYIVVVIIIMIMMMVNMFRIRECVFAILHIFEIYGEVIDEIECVVIIIYCILLLIYILVGTRFFL
jgi:hypothetical protein